MQCQQAKCGFASNLFISVYAETMANIDCLYDNHCRKTQRQLPGGFKRAGEVLLSQIWTFAIFHFHATCRAIAFQHSLPRKVSFSEDSRLPCLQSKTQTCKSTLSRKKTEPRLHINYRWHKAQARLLLHSQAINLSK